MEAEGSSQTGEPTEEDPEGLGDSFCRVVLGVGGGPGDQLESRRQTEKASVEGRSSSSSPRKWTSLSSPLSLSPPMASPPSRLPSP